MKANEILKILEQFKHSSYKKILIDGEWGIGKTKYISDFIDNYSNTCYVSLFGKKDVNTMLQEIYFQLLDQAPSGKMKKYFSIIRQKMNSLDVSYFGVSLSIPVLQNMLSILNKELSQKGTFIVVFDDLERKHDDLNIKEVFGVIDSLSKIDNIKVVLVAATDHIKDDEEKADYKNFREKAIDRIYTIEEYADEAPREILRDEVWGVIGNLAADLKSKNLRTFEKTNHFIREVTKTLGDDVFSEKFTRDDLYRMCFASVFFKIEHNGEMVLLNRDEPNSELMNIFYTTEGSGVIEYLCNFILKNSLDNDMSKSVFPHIKKWFETGTYSEEVFTSLISNINNYKDKPHNFYSSESQIEAMIDHTRSYIKNLQGDEKIGGIIANLTPAYSWCEILSVDFGISDEEILDLISPNILGEIDITKESIGDSWYPPTESEKARKVIDKILKKLQYEYFKKLVSHIKVLFDRNEYSNHFYLGQLRNSIYSISTNQSIKNVILESIENNNYFFPVPTGRITDEQWTWCHQIKKLIKEIEQYWRKENYYSDFQTYCYSLEVVREDKMLKYRLDTLFKKNR